MTPESSAVVRILKLVMCWGVNAGSGVKHKLCTTSCYALSQYAVCAPPVFSVFFFFFCKSRCVGDPSGGSGMPLLLPGQNTP